MGEQDGGDGWSSSKMDNMTSEVSTEGRSEFSEERGADLINTVELVMGFPGMIRSLGETMRRYMQRPEENLRLQGILASKAAVLLLGSGVVKILAWSGEMGKVAKVLKGGFAVSGLAAEKFRRQNRVVVGKHMTITLEKYDDKEID